MNRLILAKIGEKSSPGLSLTFSLWYDRVGSPSPLFRGGEGQTFLEFTMGAAAACPVRQSILALVQSTLPAGAYQAFEEVLRHHRTPERVFTEFFEGRRFPENPYLVFGVSLALSPFLLEAKNSQDARIKIQKKLNEWRLYYVTFALTFIPERRGFCFSAARSHHEPLQEFFYTVITPPRPN